MIERTKFAFRPDASEAEITTVITDWAVEGGIGDLSSRINPYTLEETLDGKVINPELSKDKDIIEFYSEQTERDKKETAAAKKIRDSLLTKPHNTLAVWLSPKYPEFEEDEGRITVGHTIINKFGMREMKSYGLITNLSPESLLTIGWRLSEFTLDDLELNTSENLRYTSFVFPLPSFEDNPWEFLSQYIPMPQVWEKIIDGSADRQREEIQEDSKIISGKISSLIPYAKTTEERENIALLAQDMMMQMGRPIDRTRICPTDLINQSVNNYFMQSYAVLNSNGQTIYKSVEKNWEYKPGKCMPHPDGCGESKQKVGPCGICEDCEETKYNN